MVWGDGIMLMVMIVVKRQWRVILYPTTHKSVLYNSPDNELPTHERTVHAMPAYFLSARLSVVAQDRRFTFFLYFVFLIIHIDGSSLCYTTKQKRTGVYILVHHTAENALD